jgi:hypothetical protein
MFIISFIYYCLMVRVGTMQSHVEGLYYRKEFYLHTIHTLTITPKRIN